MRPSSSRMPLALALLLLLPAAIVTAFVFPSAGRLPSQQQRATGGPSCPSIASSSTSSRRLFSSATAVHAAAATQEPVVEALAGKKPEFVLMEDGKGRAINTTMVAYLTHEGRRFCLGLPVDSPMALLDSRGKPIDPSDEVTERMFYQLDDYFTNKGYELLHTAGFLTIAGEPDWFDDEDDDDEDGDDSDDEYDTDEEDEETYDVVAREREARARTEDSVRVDPICDVEFEGSMYRVVQLLDKVPLSAEQTAEGKWALVSDASTHVKLDSSAAAARKH